MLWICSAPGMHARRWMRLIHQDGVQDGMIARLI